MINMVQTEDHLLQVMAADVDKASALLAVARHLGVEAPNVMAIGDNANDLGMIRWAGLGVAMGNASADLLAWADHVTDHNDADGVAKAIERFVLAEP